MKSLKISLRVPNLFIVFFIFLIHINSNAVINENTPDINQADNFSSLVEDMRNGSLPYQKRWKAIMDMVQLYPHKIKKELVWAVEQKEWYLKDAALKGLWIIAPEIARKKAMALLNDSSLIVRTTAVDLLAKERNPNVKNLFWKLLYSKSSFRGSQSLWIRRHIVEALALDPVKGSEGQFLKILLDKDKSLHPSAVIALEKLQTPPYKRMSKIDTVSKKKQWLSWWATNKKNF